MIGESAKLILLGRFRRTRYRGSLLTLSSFYPVIASQLEHPRSLSHSNILDIQGVSS